jgi:hypothetical protein
MIFFLNKPSLQPPPQKDPMSDSEKLKPESPPTEPEEAEDEPIIDLVEEIEDQNSSESSSPLDSTLPAIDAAFDDVAASDAGLADLEKLDLAAEGDQSQDEDSSWFPTPGPSDAPGLDENVDWLFDSETAPAATESGQPPDSATDAPWEHLEFEETAPPAEPMRDAMGPASTAAGSDDEEEDLELIEIEDDEVEEVDDELVWFDDVDLEPAPPSSESAAEAESPATPPTAADLDLFSDTSAADVFSANVASGLAATDSASDLISYTAAAVSAAAPLSTPPPAAPILPPASEEPPDVGSVSVSIEQIEAALERLIERRLGGTLESLILQAVETAVANEIQRLKTLLLNDDFDERIP